MTDEEFITIEAAEIAAALYAAAEVLDEDDWTRRMRRGDYLAAPLDGESLAAYGAIDALVRLAGDIDDWAAIYEDEEDEDEEDEDEDEAS